MEVKSVNVLGQKYKVTTRPAKEMPAEMVEALEGNCDRYASRIWINQRSTVEQYYRNLFHEIGHAAMYRNGVAFSGMVPHELEEILVETFASANYEFMRDWIKGMLKHEDNILRGKLLAFVSGAGAIKEAPETD